MYIYTYIESYLLKFSLDIMCEYGNRGITWHFKVFYIILYLIFIINIYRIILNAKPNYLVKFNK